MLNHLKILEKDGKFQVIGDAKILGEFETNREAWRFVDIQTGELLNKRQATCDWYFTKKYMEP